MIVKKEERLQNVKEVVSEFKGRLNAEIRRQEKLYKVEEEDSRRGKLPEKYIAKILYK